MKLIYCLMILLWPFSSIAQTIKPITIGDTVPDIKITNVYNYPTSSIRLSDLKGKLVILDFWSTWCSGCLEVLPKMHKLQNKFDDNLQVILINTYKGDSIKRVKSLFDKRKQSTGETVELPYSLLQSLLFEYFPYKFLPHYVWIDKYGKVIAMTTQTEVTEENIQMIIAGKDIALHTTKDIMDFDYKKPLFVNNNGGNGDALLYRSILLPYYEGVGSTVGHNITADGKVNRYFAFNQLPAELIAIAFPGEMELPLNRRYYEGDSAIKWKALLEDKDSYNGYCYETIVPPVEFNQLLHYIREDMVRYFGIVPHIETRKIKCLLLQQGSKEIAGTQYQSPQVKYTDQDSKKYMRHIPVSFVVNILNNFLPSPLVDESGVTKLIDIDLPDNLYDEKAVIGALKNAGFTVTPSEREMEITVITGNTLSTKTNLQ